MGSSKIIFVGAVAVIVGLFGFGIKKAEKKSADIAIAHAYQLSAKTLAEQGLQFGARRLPRKADRLRRDRKFERTVGEGTYGFVATNSGMPAGQVKIISTGISNGQQVQLISVLEELPRGPKPKNVKAWNGWKLVSSVRTFSTIEE